MGLKILKNLIVLSSFYIILFGGIEIAKRVFLIKSKGRFPEDIVLTIVLMLTPIFIFVIQLFIKERSFTTKYLICSVIVFFLMVAQFFIFKSFYEKDKGKIAFGKIETSDIQLSKSENQELIFFLDGDLKSEQRLRVYEYFLNLENSEDNLRSVLFVLRDMEEYKEEPTVRIKIENMLLERFNFLFNFENKNIESILHFLLSDKVFWGTNLPDDKEKNRLGKWYLLAKKDKRFFEISELSLAKMKTERSNDKVH